MPRCQGHSLEGSEAMNLYFISQDVNNGYDTYDSAVVCADIVLCNVTAVVTVTPGAVKAWESAPWK